MKPNVSPFSISHYKPSVFNISTPTLDAQNWLPQTSTDIWTPHLLQSFDFTDFGFSTPSLYHPLEIGEPTDLNNQELQPTQYRDFDQDGKWHVTAFDMVSLLLGTIGVGVLIFGATHFISYIRNRYGEKTPILPTPNTRRQTQIPQAPILEPASSEDIQDLNQKLLQAQNVSQFLDILSDWSISHPQAKDSLKTILFNLTEFFIQMRPSQSQLFQYTKNFVRDDEFVKHTFNLALHNNLLETSTDLKTWYEYISTHHSSGEYKMKWFYESYSETIWNFAKSDNTFIIYLCGCHQLDQSTRLSIFEQAVRNGILSSETDILSALSDKLRRDSRDESAIIASLAVALEGLDRLPFHSRQGLVQLALLSLNHTKDDVRVFQWIQGREYINSLEDLYLFLVPKVRQNYEPESIEIEPSDKICLDSSSKLKRLVIKKFTKIITEQDPSIESIRNFIWMFRKCEQTSFLLFEIAGRSLNINTIQDFLSFIRPFSIAPLQSAIDSFSGQNQFTSAAALYLVKHQNEFLEMLSSYQESLEVLKLLGQNNQISKATHFHFANFILDQTFIDNPEQYIEIAKIVKNRCDIHSLIGAHWDRFFHIYPRPSTQNLVDLAALSPDSEFDYMIIREAIEHNLPKDKEDIYMLLRLLPYNPRSKTTRDNVILNIQLLYDYAKRTEILDEQLRNGMLQRIKDLRN